MVTARAQEASSSMSRCTYHAFLSFRGKDTRKNFTDHLYTGLVQAGIHTFRDDDGIEKGEYIMAELQKAILESQISIIVFSKNYASSRWCLDELVKIMERRTIGHNILPVFYDVDPSQVRKQTASFAEAFARHEKRYKAMEQIDKVESWRAALREVAELGGMVLENRHESQFVQNIVEYVEKKLNRTVLNVARYLVGLESRIRDINLWVQDGSNDVSIGMICGMGGIGKTTIAKTVYNMNFDRFEGRSFLGNVRETTKQLNGLVHLQRQLLSDILKGKTRKICNADEGIAKIKDAICCKKVFLVLDDLDQLDQLNAIIGRRDWFYIGSKIIITTRHERLLGSREVFEKFKIKLMDDDESLQLFSWHAFGQCHPIESYMDCSRSFVHYCGGLPLALQVLGSSLSGRSINVWESALQKLHAIPDSNIQNVLRISYDSLQDDHDKTLFLDIACFFIGKDKDYTVGILDGCGFYTIIGMQNLIDRCLLTVNLEKKLMMHQLLRNMGREIIRQESTNDPGKRSRLWHHKDAFTILKEKTGTKTIKGLTLNLDRRQAWKDNYFKTKTFVKMHNLKLLQLNYVKLSGDYEYFPKNLVWLCWHGFSLKSIPTNVSLKKMIALDMRYSSLNVVWRGTMFLAELKFLNLSHSHGLVRTPDFSGLLSLERLIFKDCINLVEVDEYIVYLQRLEILNLKDCKNLKKLPREMNMLKSLEELNLSGCSKLDELPKDLRKMESLKVLYLDEIGPNQLRSTTRDTKRLSLLLPRFWHSTFRPWLSPTKGSHSISFSSYFLPHSLVTLSLVNCNLSDDAISYGLASLHSLQFVDLSGNPFYSLPESINGLTMLKYLKLTNCTRLQSLSGFPMSMFQLFLEVNKCTSLERITYRSFLSVISFFLVFDCENLVEIEGLFKLEPIKNTDMAVLKSLGLSNLESFESIEVALNCFFTRSPRKAPIQVLHECGISSIFLPRSEIPRCFVLKNTGPLISFRVHSLVGHKIHRLNLCTLYAFDPESSFECRKYFSHYAKIKNKTKHIRWTYEPIFFAPPRAKEEDMLWLSHWNIGDELERGDEIDVSVVFPRGIRVKMCGICFLYEPEDKGTQSNTEETISEFLWYQTVILTQAETNTNFRCHHSFTSVQNTFFTSSPNQLEDDEIEFVNMLNFHLRLKTCVFCEHMYEDD